MYVLTVTHDGFIILHINPMASWPNPSLKILTSQLPRPNLHKTYHQMYIILLYPYNVVWYYFPLVRASPGTNIYPGLVKLLVHIEMDWCKHETHKGMNTALWVSHILLLC